jgi:hypothetical protein
LVIFSSYIDQMTNSSAHLNLDKSQRCGSQLPLK